MSETLLQFDEVDVVPTTGFARHIATGGPIWPEFEHQVDARHCRGEVPVDHAPARRDAVARIATPAVWGGILDRHFGHLVAEHLPRLPLSLRERPDDLYLFTLEPGLSEADIPAQIWDLLAWYGLARAQVRIVTEPLRVACLRVAPQAEMLPLVAPSHSYLALLEARAQANALSADPNEVLYVTRSGFVAQGRGGHAGEGYLVERLREQGVAVMDPADLPLRAQLAGYAGAANLVFAEGSAVHGRQILGRIPQDIHILRRRPGRSVARAMLRPRCTRLSYHSTSAALLADTFPDGRPRPGSAAAIYDRRVLFSAFAALGVDLSDGWDEGDFHAAQIDDLRGWIAHHAPTPAQIDAHRSLLASLGLDLDAPTALPAATALPGSVPAASGAV
jgi:hypothetical protein